MKMKPMILAGIAAALLSGGTAVAAAEPGPPTPGPDTPMCWEPTPGPDTPTRWGPGIGWSHTEYVPCGWTYSAADGWQQLPPGAP